MGSCCKGARGKLHTCVRLSSRGLVSLRHHAATCCLPEPWVQRLEDWLDTWVKQKTIVIFAALELIISSWLTVVFLAHPRIADLGWLARTWSILVVILGVRALSATVGAYAALWRRVSRMRYYFGLLLANLPLSVFVAIPFGRCTCLCTDAVWDPLQCKVLDSFVAREQQGIIARRLGQARIHMYNVTDVGIRWQSGFAPTCELLDVEDAERPRLESMLARLQEDDCGGDGCHSGLSGELDRHLGACFRTLYCGGVEALLGEASSGRQLRICRYPLPLVPSLNQSDALCARLGDCAERRVFFLKNLRSFHKYQIKRLGKVGEYCRLLVSLAVFAIVLLDVLSVLMAVIVYKFTLNHCGDNFAVEDQFNVSTREFESDDDFDVDTWARRPSRTRSRTATSIRSSNGSNAAGAGNQRAINSKMSVELAAAVEKENTPT